MILICTLGKLMKYDSNPQYFVEGKLIGDGSFVIPASAVAFHFKPDRILCLCTEDVVDTFELMKEELDQYDLPEPEKIDVRVPHDQNGIDALLKVILETVPREEEIHLEVTFGLRSLTILSLLGSDYLHQMGEINLVRMTYVNFEGARESGRTEIVNLSPYLFLPRLASAAVGLDRHGDLLGIAKAVNASHPESIDQSAIRELEKIQERLLLLRTRSIASRSTGMPMLKSIRQVFRVEAERHPALEPLAMKVSQALELIIDSSQSGTQTPEAALGLAQWYFRHNNPALALVLAVEAAAVQTAIKCGIDMDKPDPNRPGQSIGKSVFELLEQAASFFRGRGEMETVAILDRFKSSHRASRNSLSHAQLSTKEPHQRLSVQDVAIVLDDLEHLVGKLISLS